MQPEAKFKKALVDAFKIAYPDSSGWFARVSGVGKDGVPDLIFHTMSPTGFAQTLWVEAKHNNKPCSSAQLLQLRRLVQLGVSACVLRCRGIELPTDQRVVEQYSLRDAAKGAAVGLDRAYRWSDMKLLSFWQGLFTL